MKITLTGSLGNISRPLARELAQKGHSVVVISSKPSKKPDIEDLGAAAAIGSLEEATFLAAAFRGADAVYCMVPPAYYSDPGLDPLEYYHRIGGAYARAIRQSGVRSVVHLSSMGAHLDGDTGLLAGHRDVENILTDLPGVAVTHVRPAAFYPNLYAFIRRIKREGMIAANYGAEDRVPWASPVDIAAAAAEELCAPSAGRKIRYVASDEAACDETARILGAAIGKPDLQWRLIPDAQMQDGLEAAGMPARLAAGLVKMNATLHSGAYSEEYRRTGPSVMGKVKLTDFAREFAAVFNQS